MCDKCVELDKKIERYRRLSSSLADQMTIDRIKALSTNCARKKLNFTLSRNRKAVPVGCLFYHVAVGRRGARARGAPPSGERSGSNVAGSSAQRRRDERAGPHVPTKFDAPRGPH
jgi:hypothetical protein